MKAFLFAMPKEASPLLESVSIKKQIQAGFTKIYECCYEGIDFLVVVSGVGKAFAAASIPALADRYEVDMMINFGVAGTLDGEKAPILSAVIGTDYVEFDLDTSAVGDPIGMVSGIEKVELPSSQYVVEILEKACKSVSVPCAKGRIVSGDTFLVLGDKRKEEVRELWHPLCIDMESAAYDQIAYVYQIPYAAVRLISDWKEPSKEYPKNVPLCVTRIKEIALQVLLS